MDEPIYPSDPTTPSTKSFPGKALNSEALKMGLVMGGLLIAYQLVLHFAGLGSSRSLAWVQYVLVLLGLYLGTRNYRDQVLGGYVSFGSAFSYGFRAVLYASLIVGLFGYIYFKTFGHGMLDEIRNIAEQDLLKNPNVSEEQAEQMMEMYKQFMIPFTMALAQFLGTLFLGTLLALITSAILKREAEFTEPPMP